MLPPPAGRPTLLGLGTAAVLAAGALPALATTAQAAAAPLTVQVSPSAQTLPAGRTARVTATVARPSGGFKGATLRITGSDALSVVCRAPAVKTAAGCDLSLVTTRTAAATALVRLSESAVKKDTTLSLTATATQAGKSASGVAEVTFTPVKDDPGTGEPTTPPPSSSPPPTSPKPSPKPSPSKTPPKPSPSPSPSLSPGSGSGPSDAKDGKDKGSSNGGAGSGSGGGSGSGSGGSGSSGSGSGNGSGSGSVGGGNGGYTPPSPNGSFRPNDAKSPQVALPPIAQSPSVAPPTSSTTSGPESRLRNNQTPVAQDLTFERMASTQVAWLAALLVAFSLLLTQLRLGRRAEPAAVAEARRRAKGTHRRPRKGLFGK
ncbi:hypothetical protein ACFVH6_03875 [Spirillospora sp. NPDC127200]